MEYKRFEFVSTCLSQFDPIEKENKNFLLKIQQVRQFKQEGQAWVDQMKAQGSPLVENLGILILDSHNLREVTSNHRTTI